MTRTHSGSSSMNSIACYADGVATGLTDQELLERFATCRDDLGELAFAALVARHGPMVMNVCRRMLRNPADADDAFQATFLVLVRRARAIRLGTSLGPWLYGVSVRVARRAREQGSRRRGVALDEQAAEAVADRYLRRSRPAAVDRRGALAAAGQFSRSDRLVLSRGPDPRRGRGQAPLPGRNGCSRLARGRALLKAARTLGTRA